MPVVLTFFLRATITDVIIVIDFYQIYFHRIAMVSKLAYNRDMKILIYFE